MVWGLPEPLKRMQHTAKEAVILHTHWVQVGSGKHFQNKSPGSWEGLGPQLPDFRSLGFSTWGV